MRLRAGLPACVIAVALLCGCSGPPSASENPYAAEFAQARDMTTDPATLEILADDSISPEEITQAQSQALSCLQDAGYEARMRGDSIEIDHPTGVGQDQVNSAYDACTATTLGLITALDSQIRSNPNNEDRHKLVYDCLRREHVIDASLTYDGYLAVDRENPPWDDESPDYLGCLAAPLEYRAAPDAG